jgi:hypothetical protein
MAANMAHGDGRERLDLVDGHQFRIVTWITIPTNSSGVRYTSAF